MDQNYTRYLKSLSDELSSTCNHIRDIIGDNHWLSDGRHKEEILHALLRKFIPNNLSIKNGFIFNPWVKGEVSGEIDLIIFDPSIDTPILNKESLAIVFPDSLLCIIHVKSLFNTNNLRNICESNKRVLSITESCNKKPYICSFFFNSNNPNISYLKTVSHNLLKSYNKYQLGDHVCVNNCYNLIATDTSTKYITSSDLSTAIFVSEILDRLTTPSRENSLSRMISRGLNLPCHTVNE